MKRILADCILARLHKRFFVSAATLDVDAAVTVYATSALTITDTELEEAVQNGYDLLFRATRIGGKVGNLDRFAR